MNFKPPKGWEPKSDALFINAAGVRIERRVYREREGWFLIPADLAQEVVYFDPTPEGRDQAFAAFAEGLLSKTSKKKALPAGSAAKPKRGRKPKEAPEEDSEKDSDEDSEETTDAKDSNEGAGKVDEDS
jgi:hypothetical protein